MHYLRFIKYIENTLQAVIRRCHPAAWNEDHISFSICQNLFYRHEKIEVEGFDRPFKILWDVRKLRLPEESEYGDIGVLVKLKTWENEIIEGVGLLEAKRRDLHSSSFPEIKPKQLKKIAKNSSVAKLLLYDYDNVTSWKDNLSTTINTHRFGYPYLEQDYYTQLNDTHCVAIPIGIATLLQKYNTSLHKFGLPLSYQIASRYLRGLDLETDQNIVESVKGNIARNGGVRYLILVGVSTGNQEPELPVINNEAYNLLG